MKVQGKVTKNRFESRHFDSKTEMPLVGISVLLYRWQGFEHAACKAVANDPTVSPVDCPPQAEGR